MERRPRLQVMPLLLPPRPPREKEQWQLLEVATGAPRKGGRLTRLDVRAVRPARPARATEEGLKGTAAPRLSNQ